MKVRQRNRKKMRQKKQWEKQEKIRQESLSREEAETAIRKHAAGLMEELNLKLFCGETETEESYPDDSLEDYVLLEMLRQAGKTDLWGELCTSDNILWVDEILITEIAYYCERQERKAKRSGFHAWMKRVFSYILEHLFSGRSKKAQNKTR